MGESTRLCAVVGTMMNRFDRFGLCRGRAACSAAVHDPKGGGPLDVDDQAPVASAGWRSDAAHDFGKITPLVHFRR
jgi:hypothetical protein